VLERATLAAFTSVSLVSSDSVLGAVTLTSSLESNGDIYYGVVSAVTFTTLRDSNFGNTLTFTGAGDRMDHCNVTGLLTFAANGPEVRGCQLSGGVTVVDLLSVFYSSYIDGNFTGPASSYRVDGSTNAISSTVALVPPATLDIVSDAPGGDSTAIHSGDAATGGDLEGTYPSPTVVAASLILAGKIEVATQTEVNTGTDTGRAVAPSTLAAAAHVIHDNVASEISAVTLKGTPVAADMLLIEDSAAVNVKKRVLFSAFGGPTVVGFYKATAVIVSGDVAGGSYYDATTPTVTFKAILASTDGILTAHVQLWNLTAGAAVATADLTTTNANPTEVTVVLTPGTTANFPAARNIYEVRIWVALGTGVEYAILHSAILEQ